MNIKENIVEVLKSVLPITIVMIILQVFMIDFKFNDFIVFSFGTLLTIIGFVLFLVGVNSGLLSFGELVGKKMIQKSNLWFLLSLGIAIGFSLTVAEPGVQVLSSQFNSLSNESFVGKNILIIAISLGVGIYLGLSIIRFIYRISFKKILMISYLIIFLLIIFSPKEFLALSFDAGGVTTGPTAVPFILSLGIGMTSIKGTKKESYESFGFVGLASIGPILAILILGVIF